MFRVGRAGVEHTICARACVQADENADLFLEMSQSFHREGGSTQREKRKVEIANGDGSWGGGGDRLPGMMHGSSVHGLALLRKKKKRGE